ncbi:MAG: hypothetical protein ACREUQ_10140 [Burkholderiales bacterium]
MAIYQSTNVRDKTAVAGPVSGGQVLTAYAEVTCTAAPSTADTIQFFYLPAGARVIGATLEATDMDTGGPTLTLNIGDAGSAARLFSASTVAQAGTLSSAIAVTGQGHQFTSKTLITGTAAANATTPAAGTAMLTVLYTVT